MLTIITLTFLCSSFLSFSHTGYTPSCKRIREKKRDFNEFFFSRFLSSVQHIEYSHKFSFPVKYKRGKEKKGDFFIVLSYNTEIMKKYEQPGKKRRLRETSSIETVMSEERHNLIESKR